MVEMIVKDIDEQILLQQSVLQGLKGKEVTILFQGSTGFFTAPYPDFFHCVIESVDIKPYAQYKNAIFLFVRRPRKRTHDMVILHYNSANMVIFDGKVFPQCESTFQVVKRADCRITNKGMAFDPLHFDAAVSSLKPVEPVFTHHNMYKERLRDRINHIQNKHNHL